MEKPEELKANKKRKKAKKTLELTEPYIVIITLNAIQKSIPEFEAVRMSDNLWYWEFRKIESDKGFNNLYECFIDFSKFQIERCDTIEGI